NVQKLLLTIKHRQLYHHDGQPDFSVMKAKDGAPLSEREMMIIDYVAKGTPVNAIARALGLRVKTIYAHLDKIKANFNLKGGSHFHRFMISPPSYHLL
ncbi:LuxR C-terminal-related transcriptional regulator, partial [Klebsiella aerogenes]